MSNRDNMMDRLDALYSYAAGTLGKEEAAWSILLDFNADEQESDPYEGYMGTMSDNDLTNAIHTMEKTFLGPEVVIKLREKELAQLRDILDHYPTHSSDEAKLIEFISDKLALA